MTSRVRARISSRGLGALCGLAFIVFALSACKVDSVVTLKVKENGSGTLNIDATADPQVVTQAPGLAKDLRFGDAKAAGWIVSEPAPTADGGLSIHLSHNFSTPQQATMLLSQLGGANGPFNEMSLERTGKDTNSTWVLNGRLEFIGGLDAFGDPELLNIVGATPYAATLANSELDAAQAVGIEFRAFLPGKIESTTGVSTLGYAQWNATIDGSSQNLATVAQNMVIKSMIARAVAPIFLFILIIWVLGIVGFGSFVAFTRYKRSRRTPTK